jgi:hypothetical protein
MMMSLVLCVALVALLCGQCALAKPDCFFKDGSGLTYNLTSAKSIHFVGADVRYNYKMAVCDIAAGAGQECLVQGGSICVTDKGNGNGVAPKFVGTMGAFNVAQPAPATWESFDDEDPTNSGPQGVILTYKNGLMPNTENNETLEAPTVYVRFPCDYNIDEPINEFEVEWTMGMTAIVSMTPSKIGCPSKVDPLIHDSPMSVGWILIIVLAVGTTFYCCVGTIYNMSQFGTTGVDSIPNSEFWRDLPSLVVEGCRFVCHKLRPNSGYQRHDDNLFSDL